MMFTGNIYSNKQNLQKPPELHVENLLLIYYKGDKTAPGQTISDKYRNSLNEHCLRKSFDAERNVIDSLHYILSIADILDSCVAYINSSTSKEIITQDNLKRYKSTILEFFNVIPDIKTPINVPQNSKDGITSWGFVHGLLNIKQNKCNKDIKPTSKLVFTIDAEGTTGKEYLNMFNRFNFISNDTVYSKLDLSQLLGQNLMSLIFPVFLNFHKIYKKFQIFNLINKSIILINIIQIIIMILNLHVVILFVYILNIHSFLNLIMLKLN